MKFGFNWDKFQLCYLKTWGNLDEKLRQNWTEFFDVLYDLTWPQDAPNRNPDTAQESNLLSTSGSPLFTPVFRPHRHDRSFFFLSFANFILIRQEMRDDKRSRDSCPGAALHRWTPATLDPSSSSIGINGRSEKRFVRGASLETESCPVLIRDNAGGVIEIIGADAFGGLLRDPTGRGSGAF